MNTYIVPIVDTEDSPIPYIHKLIAKSLSDCEDKLVRWVYDEWDCDFTQENYQDLVKELIEFGIYFGEIEEIDD